MPQNTAGATWAFTPPSTLPTTAVQANIEAVQQLERSFLSVDRNGTGLLPCSEFALQILRNGGTQPQVDALIEKFSHPSRAQRLVRYVAFLEQLYDSVDGEAVLHQPHRAMGDFGRDDGRSLEGRCNVSASPARASSMDYNDTADRSPSPVSPMSHEGPSSPCGLSSSPSATVHNTTPAVEEYRRSTSLLQPIRPSTSIASETRALPTLRDSSLASYHADVRQGCRSQCQQQSSRIASPLPHAPVVKPTRLVQSALRVAAATSASRSASLSHHSVPSSSLAPNDCASCSTSALRSPSGGHHLHQRKLDSAGRTSRPCANLRSRLYPDLIDVASTHTPPTMERTQEDSLERMKRIAAAQAVSRSFHADGGRCDVYRDSGKTSPFVQVRSTGPTTSHSPDPHRPCVAFTHAPLASTETASSATLTYCGMAPASEAILSKTSTHNVPVDPYRHHDEQKSSGRGASSLNDISSSGSNANVSTPGELLSLRNIFEHHLRPHSSQYPDGVLLSELQAALALRGVKVHPLELEAVADSLELSGVDSTRGNAAESDTTRMSSRAADEAATAMPSWSTKSSGSDRLLTLIDFCVLVSRLRPAIIHRIRSRLLWDEVPQKTEEGRLASREGCHLEGKDPRTAAAEECRSGHSSGRCSEAACIVDVTVSPMTPSPATSASPELSPRSMSSGRAQARASSRRCSGIARRRHSASPLPNKTPASPPLARQLSLDRSFAVRPRQQHACSSNGSGEKKALCIPSAPSPSYAQPTASAVQHRRRSSIESSAAAATLRRRASPRFVRDGATVTAFCSRTDVMHPSRSAPSPPSHRSQSLASPPPSCPIRVSLCSPCEGSLRDADGGGGQFAVAAGGARNSADSWLHLRSCTTASPSPQPESPASAVVKRTGFSSLPSRLLEVLQRTALTLLRTCAQRDKQRTGRLPRDAWRSVVRTACPTLTGADVDRICRWIHQRHPAVPGDDHYAAVVEDILTQTTVGESPVGADSDTDRQRVWTRVHAPEKSHKHHHRTQSAISEATCTFPSTGYSHTKPAATQHSVTGTHVRVSQRNTRSIHSGAEEYRKLASELNSVCGGDTEALRDYFRAFDTVDTGYLEEHVWRSSLAELFRRTTSRPAPRWVLDGCVRLAKAPHACVTPPHLGDADYPNVSTSPLMAARVRLLRVPTTRWRNLCDYRYVLEELCACPSMS